MSAATVIVGLDGATFALLDRLIAEGVMPTLGALVANGMRGGLASTVPPITPAAWASFLTGKRPGKHGVYDFRVYDPRAYRDTFVSSRAIRGPTVFQLLAAAGRRVASVNLPMTYPPAADAGVVVGGFDTPSTGAAFTAPADLHDWIRAEMPDYSFVATVDPQDADLVADAAFERFVAAIERGIEQRTRLALHLLDGASYDVFLLHHQEPDALQHKAWPLLARPADGSARAARVRAAYRTLDDALATLLARAGRDARVFVVSDHGFGVQTGRVFPNVLLRRWGYLRGPSRWRTRLRRSVGRRLARLGLGGRASRSAGGWDERVREVGFARALPLRWEATRAYVAAAEIYGLLYVNLRGREPGGIVEPGPAYEALREELRVRFLAVRDPVDGEPLFADVVRGEDVDPDDAAGRRPDLVLVPRAGFTVARDLNDRLWADRHRRESGTHRPDGVLVASGPGLRRGRLDAPAAIVDLAPTLLAAAGVPVPDDMDGRVLTELFEEPLEVRRVAASATDSGRDSALSADEERAVTERLRALGYMT